MSNHIYYCIFSFFEIASAPQYGLQCAVFVSAAEISGASWCFSIIYTHIVFYVSMYGSIYIVSMCSSHWFTNFRRIAFLNSRYGGLTIGQPIKIFLLRYLEVQMSVYY